MKKYFGNFNFYKTVFVIAVPIMLQQFVTSFVNLIDNVMIGNVNSIALSAVSVTNRVYLLLNSSLFGVCGAASIFLAQYYGANNDKNCHKIFHINVVCSIFCALFFMVALILIPKNIISLFTSQQDVIEEGLKYVKYIIYSYIPFSISYSIMMSLRSVGINKIQLYIGIFSMCLNTLVNYCLIFGHFGFMAMGVKGAAIATTFTRIIEMIIYICLLISKKYYFSLDLQGLFHLDFNLISSMVKKAVPLAMNEIMFSLALTIIFFSYSHCDETLISAISVVDTTMQMAYIIFSGISSAIAILIGVKLGANELQEAKDNSLKLIVLAILIGIIVMLVMEFIAPFISKMYHVDVRIKEHIVLLLRIKSFILPFYVYNVCIFFTLRAGGDTLSTLVMDSGFLWCVQVILSLIVSMNFTIPLVYLYVLIEYLDLLKIPLATFFYKKGHWINNLTE